MLINKNFRIISLAVVFLALIFSGFGCKGLSQEEMAATKPVVLNYWTVYNDVDQIELFAKEYKKIRSYVTINIRQVRYDEFDSLFANALADDVAPNIVSMHTRWLRRYQNRLDPAPDSVNVTKITIKGKLKPETLVSIDNNAMPTKNFLKKAYVSTVAEDVIIDDKIYGYPLAVDTLAMYYNKELLDKAGIPIVPKNWLEFSEAVKKSTRYGKDGEIFQSGTALGTGENISNAFDIISLLFAQNGVKMANERRISFMDGINDQQPNHPTFQTMRFYTDFARPTKDVYSWNEKMGEALSEFARGKVVFYFGFAYDRPRIKTLGPQLKFDIEPVPQLSTAVPANVANYWVESVVAKSANKDEAWDFIRFMSEPANLKKYVSATKQPSPLREQILEQQEDPELGPFAMQALTAQNWYRGKNIEAASKAFNEMFTAYLEPYVDDSENLKRNLNILSVTQSVVQQTY